MSQNVTENVEKIAQSLVKSDTLSEDRYEQIVWEMNKQAQRLTWEKRKHHTTHENYSKSRGDVCALPRYVAPKK